MWVLLFVLLFGFPPENEPQKKKPEVVVVDPQAPATVAQPESGDEPNVEYALNPVQARKEFQVGEYYLRKGSYPAAVTRFQEAVKWNPKFAAAWLKLGEAAEKRGELTRALEAYRKYLELEPSGKKARDAKKAVARVEKDLKS